MINVFKRITILCTGCLLLANTLFAFSRQDTLRGSNGNGRNWWDVQHYQLQFYLDTASRTIGGENQILFKVIAEPKDSMQIDLQEPMSLDSIGYLNKSLSFVREGNVYWILNCKRLFEKGQEINLAFYYHGKPREAVKPPWDGGFIWTKDSLGNQWISVACQGLGASSWWPCKDYQGDEPDNGMDIRFDLPEGNLSVISNGQMTRKPETITYDDPVINKQKKMTSYFFSVHNPINTYDATFYIGDYTNWVDTFKGKKGVLDISYNTLRYNEQKGRAQFTQVKKMLEAFEYWFGPYPFYEDGYKIVEAPFLGMEHQSAIAYGNKYQNGYLGRDRSGSGVGLLFDFIIVHESGHEWFGNSITAAYIADNWIHEGFTTYSETLFAEYWFGKEKAFEYCRGEWKNIKNDQPVIGQYGVNDDGSGDKYDKGSALVHTIRLLMNDDEKFRAMLHKMNDTFYHQQISSKQMEDFITSFSGLSLQAIFDQYLRSTMIPELQWRQKGKKLKYRFVNVTKGFELPVTVNIQGQEQVIKVNEQDQELRLPSSDSQVSFPPEFLITTKKLD